MIASLAALHGPRTLLVAISIVFAGSPLAGAVDRFSVAAPEGGTVVVLATDPGSGALYAGTRRAGVFRSSNGGRSWRRSSRGLGGAWVSALSVAPSAPEVLYAGLAGVSSGIFRSNDRGASWVEVGRHQVPGAWGLAVHPHDPDRVVVANGDRIWRTMDGGVSWTDVTPPSPPGLFYTYRIPLFDPSQPSTIYVASNGGIAKTVDLGETWTHRASKDDFVLALIIDPAHPQTLWAGVEGGVLRTDDGGDSWTFLSLPVDPYDAVTALALDPADPSVLYAAAGASELAGSVLRSDDGGASWEPLLSPTGVLAMAVDGERRGRLWIGLRDLGVLESTDGGHTWQEARSGLTATGITALVVDRQRPERLLAGLEEAPTPLARTEDGGETWLPVAVDLGTAGAASRTTALVAGDADPVHLLYGIFDGILGVSADFGRSWGPLAGHPPYPVQAMAASSFGRLLAVAEELIPCDLGLGCEPIPHLHLFRSVDEGESWLEVALPGGATLHGPPALAIAASDPSVVYLAGGAFFVSNDGGGSWKQVGSAPLPPIFDIAVHPLDSRVIYAASSFRAGGVVRSLDGGETWLRPRAGLPRGQQASQAVFDVLVDPLAPERVYAASSAGVFASSDGGVSWAAFSQGLGGAPARVLALDSRGPGTLYAGGPEGGGLFARTRGPAGCSDVPDALCLAGGRFRVAVSWRDFAGSTGTGRPAPWLDDSGGFWFFTQDSLEVVVKVVDGRPLNGHFWVFVSSLTNVAFEVSIVDTRSGAVWTHANPLGRFASFADFSTF